MTLELLANAGSDPLDKILPWITTFVAMVLAAVFKLQAEKAKAMRIEEPVPTVPTRKVSNPPSWDQHDALVRRVTVIEGELKQLRDENTREYKQLLEAGSQRETRLIEKIDDVARAIHSRIDEFFKPKGGRA